MAKKIKKINILERLRLLGPLYWVFLFALTLFIRAGLVELETVDLVMMREWVGRLREHGGFLGLGSTGSVYGPLYDFLIVSSMTIFTWTAEIAQMKAVGIFFDYVCAYFVFRLVGARFPKPTASLAALLTLLTPTLLVNSSAWGQVDSLFTAGVLGSVFFSTQRRPKASLVAFALGFSAKPQGIFLLPFIVAMWTQERFKMRHFLLVPTVYLVTGIPAILMGYSTSRHLFRYFSQSTRGDGISEGAMNIYQLASFSHDPIMFRSGLALAVVIAATYVFAFLRKKIDLRTEQIILMALVSTLLMPLFLPKMHERYFLSSDLLSIVYAFYFPRYFWVSPILILVSYFSYWEFLWARTPPIPPSLLALSNLGIFCFLVFHLMQTLGLSKELGTPTKRLKN